MPKNSITRRGFATLASGAGIASALPLCYADAAEHTFKIGTNVPASPACARRGLACPARGP